MKNKVKVITGGSSGLGKELAIRFTKEALKDQQPTTLVLVGRNTSNLKLVQEELTSLIGKKDASIEFMTLKADVSKKNDCKQIIDKIVHKHGRIDYFISNAGVTMWNRFSELDDPDVLKEVMEINYLGSMYLTYYLIQAMKKGFKCKMVYISSLQSTLGTPYHTGYSASKHALEGFVKALSLEEDDFSYLIFGLGWVRGTNLRKNAFGEELNEKKNTHLYKTAKVTSTVKRKFTLSHIINKLVVIKADRCAERISYYLPRKDRVKLYLPWETFLIPYFFLFLPHWVNEKIKKITHKEKNLGS